MKLPTRYFVFFAWIPTSLALAYGSISFMLLDPNIPEWSFCARFSMLLGWAWLLYISVRVTEELACFFWSSRSVRHHFLCRIQLPAFQCCPRRVVTPSPLPLRLSDIMAGILPDSF
ncbi:MAG: hypothetical protein MR460_00565 [Bilophila wadsworthia]|uniref:hypothetical protein n=1 Tax=Bilophila wadsworthia TaxID=35833 RepID=UPI002430A4A5|nr:hypothetical protein [Bilophila wadsworthia]MCI6538625.1 hypothetical protein [Bilophila wadsworthia]